MKKKGVRASSAPLLSWDVFSESIHRREFFAEDIRSIQLISQKNNWIPLPGISVDNALIWENKTVVITDPHLHIIFATTNLEAMTGYTPGEVIGKTPKMFQGRLTRQEIRAAIRRAVEAQQAFDVTLTNYKKDGSTYECHVEAYPVFNTDQQLVHFIAFENAA